MIRQIRACVLFALAWLLVAAAPLPRQDLSPSRPGQDFTLYLPIVVKDYSGLEETVAVKSSSDFMVGSSYLYIVGEVANQTPTNVRYIFLKATLFDAGGNPVYSTQDPLTTLVKILKPGMKSPFVLIISSPPAYARYEVTLTYSDTASEPYVLEASNVSTHWDNVFNAYHVSGEARNQTGDSRSGVKAVVTLYDAVGNVIGAASKATTPANLTPGQAASFDTEISAWEGSPDRNAIQSYALQVVDD